MNISRADAIWISNKDVLIAAFSEGSDEVEDRIPCAHLEVWFKDQAHLDPLQVYGEKARTLFRQLRGDSGPIPPVQVSRLAK